MAKKNFIWFTLLMFIFFSVNLFAQQQIFDFEEGADSWITECETEQNEWLLEDYYDDSYTGDGCLCVTGKFRYYPNDWGTYTDAQYIFPNKLDLSQYDEIRFWVKILDRPKVNRSLFFTCALMDYPEEATGRELWQWEGDYDILYTPIDDWFEVIIPFDRLVIPEWETVINNVFDSDAVYGFDFTVQGDSTAPDSIRFLIDNLVAVQKVRDVPLVNFDDNETEGVWDLWIDDPTNVFELKDNYDDMFEGQGCLEVRCVMTSFPHLEEGWGTAQEAMYNFAEPVDLTGATELRFMLDVVQEPAGKDVQFSVALTDKPEGSGEESWVLPDKWGTFMTYGRPEGWMEVVYPFAEFSVPDWVTPVNNQFDLDSIIRFGFTVGGDGSAADSVVFRLDDLYVTHGEGLTAVEKTDLMVPEKFHLSQNYPNPFNPETTIWFTLDSPGRVSLKIYNSLGQLVKTVIDNRNKLRGAYEYKVDMSNMPSGVYFYELSHAGQKITKKMVLTR